VLLDIYVATGRYRLLELDAGGEMMAAHDLPAGLHLQDGLTGIAVGPSGELWVELEFGARVAEIDPSNGSSEFTITPGYPYPAGRYGPAPDNTFGYRAGAVQVGLTTTADFGGLTMLGVNPDGSFVLVLDEVSVDGDAFRVDESVHLFDESGNHLGAAAFPVEEQYVEVGHALAIGPDGNAYGLITRPDHVAVALLPYGPVP
jgi:hypothetical protein